MQSTLIATTLLVIISCAFVSAEGVEAPVLAAILQENEDALITALTQGASPNQLVGGWAALHAAASRGNADWVKLLLQFYADPDIANNDGRTPLHEAVSENRVQVVEVLLERANPNAIDSKGESPLHSAAAGGNVEIVKLLLKAKANPDLVNNAGATPIFYAAAYGNLEVARELINAGANVKQETPLGLTPLFEASINGNVDLVRLLLDSGVPASKFSVDGWSALHNAAKYGRPEVVQLLINRGAVVDAEHEESKQTPLFVACLDGDDESVRILLDNKADPNHKVFNGNYPIHAAAAKGNINMVKALVIAGADVNVRDKDGTTPLATAVFNGHISVIRYLLSQKANPNLASYEHRFYPVTIAAAKGNVEAIRMLLEFGADLRLSSFERTYAIHAAAVEGQYKAVEFLLSHGADPNLPDVKGWSTLHISIQKGQLDIVRLLLDHGVDPNLTHNGVLPVTLAGITKNPAIVELLLQRGANPNSKDSKGWTPIQHLSGIGAEESVNLLIAFGADVNHRNDDETTALQVAQENRQFHIVPILAQNGANLDDIDVELFLENAGFPELVEKFKENSITGSVLPDLTRELLRSELGLTKLGPLVKLEKALSELRPAKIPRRRVEL